MGNVPVYVTNRPVREFKRLFSRDIDFFVGGLMDYGYSEEQIEEITGLKPSLVEMVITRNQYNYEVDTPTNPNPRSTKK